MDKSMKYIPKLCSWKVSLMSDPTAHPSKQHPKKEAQCSRNPKAKKPQTALFVIYLRNLVNAENLLRLTSGPQIPGDSPQYFEVNQGADYQLLTWGLPLAIARCRPAVVAAAVEKGSGSWTAATPGGTRFGGPEGSLRLHYSRPEVLRGNLHTCNTRFVR